VVPSNSFLAANAVSRLGVHLYGHVSTGWDRANWRDGFGIGVAADIVAGDAGYGTVASWHAGTC
jgi:hypothetical protein